jgi:Ca2+-binding RTX toxin-like protein
VRRLAATASAAGAQVGGQVLTYSAGPGEPNDVTIQQLSGGSHRITDLGATITPGAGCTAVSAHQVVCSPIPQPPPLPTLPIAFLNVALGDQDDSARIAGTTPSQVLGGAGRDLLTGGSANDALNANTGAGERLRGGAGNDVLSAAESSGASQLTGGPGHDTLAAANPSATVTGLSTLDGGDGNDTLNGQAGQDHLIGGLGADTISGGGGADLARYDERTENVIVTLGIGAQDGSPGDEGVVNGVTRRDDVKADIEGIIGGAGHDHLGGQARGDILAGGPGGDTLAGLSGNDVLCGGGAASQFAGSNLVLCTPGGEPAGDDILNGDVGDDLLIGGAGGDVHNGGTGVDTASWSERTRRVVVTAGDGSANDGEADTDPGAAGSQPEGDAVAADVENLSGGTGNDALTGSASPNGLLGGAGADTLVAQGGDDILCGDSQQGFEVPVTRATGVTCNAQYQLTAADGDRIDAGAGDDLLNGERGPDVLLSGDQVDTVTYFGRSAGIFATIADDCAGIACAQANDGQPGEGDTISLGTENVIGGFGSDTISGNGGPNVLTGGSGADQLDGRAGRDVLVPGGGDGPDVVTGGTGIDMVDYAPGIEGGVTVSLDGVANDGVEGETDNAGLDVEGIVGSGGADVLSGQPSTAVANILLGNGGDDSLDGFAGNDVLDGGLGLDELRGGTGNDLLASADLAADTLVDCGTGAADEAEHDQGLDSPVGCEILSPVTVPAAARFLR